MKPVQLCTGFILCTFPASVTAKFNYQIHLKQFTFKHVVCQLLDFLVTFRWASIGYLYTHINDASI